jgi:hypothetical protein
MLSKKTIALTKTGLSENEAHEFVEVTGESLAINLVTKKDLKEAGIRLVKYVIGLLFVQATLLRPSFFLNFL